MVRLELQQQQPLHATALPSASRLGALFHQACPEAVQPHQRHAYPERPPPPVQHAHQRWQIDGKEKVPIGDSEFATILDVRDPAAALIIASRALLTTTPRGWRKVTRAEVQATLRGGFAEYGLPLQIQTDHEVVYTGSPSADFPSRFTLWLVGLGIEHLTSRTHCPTDQAQVERQHRTLADMGWKDQAVTTLAALQHSLEACRQRYNHAYPVQAGHCQGQAPLVAQPHAQHSGRVYHSQLESVLFDMERVKVFLARSVWQRQVSAAGNVGVGDQLYSLGRGWAHQAVSVRYQPRTHTFRFENAAGVLIKDLPVKGLERADLLGELAVACAEPLLFQLPLPLEGI
jgi:transposase InsO family protein